jgi:tetratricopeptide (TPR) repeat protein
MRSLTQAFFIIIGLLGATAARSQPVQQERSAGEEELARIQQLIQSGDLRNARGQLDQALARLPGDPRIYNLLGVVDAQEHRFREAESNFRRAIQAAPGFAGAYLNLGRLYQEYAGREPGATEKAITVYGKLLQLEPGHIEANYQTALLLTREGEFAASLKHLARLPADAQDRPAALALRCSNQAALGRMTDAQEAARKLLSADGLAELDVLSTIPVLTAHHADDLATFLLDGLVQRGLASNAALRQLSALHESRGRFKEARQAIEKELESEQPSAPVLMRLAMLAYRAGDLEGSLGYLAHARDLEPNNAAVHFFFGMVCVELKLPPEAKKSLSEAVRLEPDNPHYNYAFGAVLLQQKDAEEAVPRFRKYRDARPDDPRGRFALGVAYFDGYQLESARKELESAATRPETRVGAQLYLGRLALREEKVEEAMEHLQQAIEANPSLPDPYAELALICIRRRDYPPAAKHLAAALKLAPDHYLSNLYLLMMYQRTKDPRSEAQSRRVEELQKAGEERERLLLRTLDIRPYGPTSEKSTPTP